MGMFRIPPSSRFIPVGWDFGRVLDGKWGGNDTELQTVVCHFVHNVGYDTVLDSDFAMSMKIE